MAGFLLSRADLIGAEYVALSKALIEKFKALEALSLMYFDISGTHLFINGPSLHIPAYQVPSMKTGPAGVQSNALFVNPSFAGQGRMQWVMQEKARMREIGINVE
jgi:hypothetical protein